MIKVYFGFVCVVILSVSLVEAADRSPATLMCMRNATSSRGYVFDENRWLGVLVPSGSSNPPFEVSVTGKSGPMADRAVERVFSGLDTESPKVREIQGKNASEFQAKVVRRYRDSVVVLWANDPTMANWIWLAQIDRLRRVAVVTSVYDGWMYTGGELETMDCR